jgi:isopentenyldiphosphate isomerase
LAEELGITAVVGLQHAFTIPAEQSQLGGCNAYEHVFFLPRKKNETVLSLGTEEVSEVSWVEIIKLLDALENGDDRYAPRTKQYVDAMRAFLEEMMNDYCN